MCGAPMEEGQEYTYVFPNGNESAICESCFNKGLEDEAVGSAESVESSDYIEDDFDNEPVESQKFVNTVAKSKAAKTKKNQQHHSGNYKCVPAPTQIVINSKDDYYSAVGYFEKIK